MRAGDLRHRITIQRPVQTLSASNENVTTWTDVASVWAAIDWGSGRRFTEAKQLNAEVSGVVRIHYRSDVQSYWRIIYKSRTFEIISLANTGERGVELVMTCKEAQD